MQIVSFSIWNFIHVRRKNTCFSAELLSKGYHRKSRGKEDVGSWGQYSVLQKRGDEQQISEQKKKKKPAVICP